MSKLLVKQMIRRPISETVLSATKRKEFFSFFR
uniref:Uncharacterized protein n=1 Tax=Rhizophora mucronata TaxID=61149 RepID=A0A2P2R033_RHIMU